MQLFMNTRDFQIEQKVKEINKEIANAQTPREIKALRVRADKMVRCFMRMDKALAQGLAL